MKQRFLTAAAAVLALTAAASCSKSARVSGVIEGASDRDVIVSLLNINKLQVVDTIRTGADGKFGCRLDVTKGNPEFYYFDCGGRKVASVVVDAGDRIRVEADTLGDFTLTGSAEAELYSKVEKDYRDFTASMDGISAMMASDPEHYSEHSRDLTNCYVNYYRDRVRFILANSHSIAVVPVFYQQAGSLPVFAQQTDAMHFKNVSDSLAITYPDSRYVKALRSDAEKRMNEFQISTRLQTAQPVDFPDIVLPDINGQKRKLSDIDSKVVLLHFWSNSIPEQRQFNLEVLKPVYQMYYGKGLEIYQVALDADKGSWASTVRSQNIPWISVCDIDASASRYATLYMLDRIPKTFIMKDGKFVDVKIESVGQLISALDSLLK